MHQFPDLEIFAYPSFRCEIRTGDLLFASGQGGFAELAQQTSRTCWNHVGLIWRLDPFDRILVLESHEYWGARALPLSCYVRNHEGQRRGYPGRIALARHRRFLECASTEALREMAAFAWGSLGRPPSPKRLEDLVSRLVSPAIGIDGCTSAKRGQGQLAAEFVAHCYEHLGLHLREDQPPVTTAHFIQDPNFSWLCELEVEQDWLSNSVPAPT